MIKINGNNIVDIKPNRFLLDRTDFLMFGCYKGPLEIGVYRSPSKISPCLYTYIIVYRDPNSWKYVGYIGSQGWPGQITADSDDAVFTKAWEYCPDLEIEINIRKKT
jgi:hypothetical protein